MTPAVQTTVRVGSVSPLGEPSAVGGDLLQRRAEADVDAAAAQLAQRVVGEPCVDLRQDPIGRLDQNPAHPVQAGARVALDRVGGEVLQLGERLQAGVAAPDEDVGEQLVAARRVLGRVGRLQRLDHVVAQPDRVGEGFEADRVLVEAGNRQHPGDRAERQQQLVVVERLGVSVAVAQLDRAGGGIVCVDLAQPQIGPPEDLAQRRDHVPRLERPGRRLRQERRVEHEVDVVDEDEPGRLPRHDPLELPRRHRATETPTGDDDVPSHAVKPSTL